MRPALCFVVESGSDVRMIDELARRFRLTVLGREIRGGRIVSQDSLEEYQLLVGPAGRVPFFFFVLRHILRAPATLLLCQGYGLAALATNLAGGWSGRRTNLIVCSPVEAYYSCRRYPDSRLAYRPVEFALLALVARLNAFMGPRYLVLSEHLADVVRTHGASDLRTVPVYGVDFNVYSPGDRGSSMTRQDMGLPPHDHLVFFSSRIAPEKDAATLLEAVGLLRNEDLPVTVVHRSGGFEDFKELAASLALAGSVDADDAVPPGPALADLYRVCDLCVQASRQEGLGFSVLEAMACGTTVVAAAVGGLKETVIDGETGWAYEVGNPASLASAIRASLSDTEEAARRRSAALSMVRHRYGVDRVFNLLEEALSQ